MFPTFELEKPAQYLEGKESDFTWATQGQACRRKAVSTSLYDT